MSFFEPKTPLYQMAGRPGSQAGGGGTDPKTQEVVDEAAKPTEKPSYIEPVLEATSNIPPEVGTPPAVEEEEAKEPPAIGKLTGTLPVPLTQSQQATQAVYNQTLQAMQKADQLDELSYYVTEDQAMRDAEELYAADHEAASELIGKAMASYKNRVERLDRELEEYRNTDIDPNRIFKNMTGAGRFAAALNVAVGQMSATATGGPNAAMQLVENAIDRDILAQQNEQQVMLNAIQQGRGIASEEWTVAQEMVEEKAKLRALAFAHLQQRIQRMKGEVRTAKAQRNLEAFEVLAAGKRLEAEVAAKQAFLAGHIDAKIHSAAQANRLINVEIPAMLQVYQQAMGKGQVGEPGLTEADLPAFAKGPEAPVEPAPEAERPEAPTTPTAAALGERRQRKQAVRPTPVTPTEPEAVEAPVEAPEPTEAPLTPAEAEAELAAVPGEPVVTLAPGERVAQKIGRLPAQQERVSVREFGRQGSIDEARRQHGEWLETHRLPELTREEELELSPTDLEAYERAQSYYEWVEDNPAVFERQYRSGPEEEDFYTNYVEIEGLGAGGGRGRETYYLRQDSPLRLVHKTKRGADADPHVKLRQDIEDKKVATRDAADAARLVERIGVPGRLKDFEFRAEPVYDDQGNLIDLDLQGLWQEQDADVVRDIRQLRTKLVGMAAKFVKAFDQTSRLSDQDMRLAMQTLGFSDTDTFLIGMMNALGSGDNALVQGYADFMRMYGENQQKDFRLKWRNQGVIFPPETESRARQEAVRNLQEIRNR